MTKLQIYCWIFPKFYWSLYEQNFENHQTHTGSLHCEDRRVGGGAHTDTLTHKHWQTHTNTDAHLKTHTQTHSHTDTHTHISSYWNNKVLLVSLFSLKLHFPLLLLLLFTQHTERDLLLNIFSSCFQQQADFVFSEEKLSSHPAAIFVSVPTSTRLRGFHLHHGRGGGTEGEPRGNRGGTEGEPRGNRGGTEGEPWTQRPDVGLMSCNRGNSKAQRRLTS